MGSCYISTRLFNHSFTYLNWSSHPEVFLRKGVLKICSKFTGEHPCHSVISIKLLCKFIEIILRHGCSPANLLHVFRMTFPENTSDWMLLCLTGSIARSFPVNICWSWRRLEDLLQDVLRRLQDVLEDEKLLHWRRLEDMSWRRLEDMSWRHVLKMSWRHVLKTS